LTDRQNRIVEQYAILQPDVDPREAFKTAVRARLSSRPGDAAVKAACINSALEGNFVDMKTLTAHRLIIYDKDRIPGNSREVRGVTPDGKSIAAMQHETASPALGKPAMFENLSQPL
jgi:hypothetical protein